MYVLGSVGGLGQRGIQVGPQAILGHGSSVGSISPHVPSPIAGHRVSPAFWDGYRYCSVNGSLSGRSMLRGAYTGVYLN